MYAFLFISMTKKKISQNRPRNFQFPIIGGGVIYSLLLKLIFTNKFPFTIQIRLDVHFTFFLLRFINVKCVNFFLSYILYVYVYNVVLRVVRK